MEAIAVRQPDAVTEEWRDVVGYEGRYQVSNLGRVWSAVTKRALRPAPTSRGYLSVGLYDGSRPKRQRSFCVHDLVAVAFNGPKPNGMTVDHCDGNKRNNQSTNLEYVTQRVNTQRAERLGLTTHPTGPDSANGKLSWDQVRQIRRRANVTTRAALAREFRVSEKAILMVIRNETYKE